MLELTLVPAVLLFTTTINAVVSFIGWKRRSTKTGLYAHEVAQILPRQELLDAVRELSEIKRSS